MFSKKWETSKRKYQAVHEPEVAIPASAGFTLDSDVFRPDSDERFPVILSVFPFYKEKQNQPVKPVAVCPEWVMAEGGDYNFYVRRGYVHVFANLRGTGKSGGEFDHLGDGTIQDMYDAIEWLAKQLWCDGQVATFGTSYFSMPAKRVAELKPPSLKTIFPGEVYEFNIEVIPTGVLIKAGCRFGITIKCADKDDKPRDFLDLHGLGHLWRETAAQVTIEHNNQYPSHLLVPITKGNRIGTFLSGGILEPLPEH